MIIRYILSGLRNLPGYGPHPGTSILMAFVVLGFASGLRRGLPMGLMGAGVMLVVLGPPYLIGAYDRGRGYATRKDQGR